MKISFTPPAAQWGPYEQTIKDWYSKCDKSRIVPRLWQRDVTLWSKDPAAHKEIKNRLGWLALPRTMRPHLNELKAFQDEVKAGGYQNVVLLGMGGSSLAPEVMQNILGNAPGFPKLVVLDSTDPGRVKDVEAQLDLAKTLFIVSSKSGGTVELVSFFKYFFDKMKAVKPDNPGSAFIAITDPGTSLETLAKQNKFRKTFLAPEDVGGRFSALTVFGLVPACAIGADVAKLLNGAERMMAQCSMEVSLEDNAAFGLGMAMAVLAEEGRDKLTLVSSDTLASFGDWAEQLIAESTGKEGSGVLPVVREPLEAAENYGEDRFFVELSLETETKTNAAAVQSLALAGHPVFSLSIKQASDLGAEFFRWEVATAIACALLKVNAFDQPNVQSAKESAKRFLAKGKLDPRSSERSLEEFWENAEPGDYTAILAFLPDREPVRQRLEKLRDAIRQRSKLASTLGFGPRYLHSTGQLHKGGPSNGLFILFTSPAPEDLPVAGESYTFAGLETAQAMGDLEALENSARWAIHVRLPELTEQALDEACAKIEAAIQAPVAD
jgi:glucose-6-phosphate isomerase